ncbi:ABC transporter substrate-binding protein [Phytomonospora endophytica]|uniref:Peptide/nickel transport system substrate-binding protein n=1 Tax=Phytomonospora endophytica TaxID=714109 RepID=A0A841FUT4_9ACTN|nr:ABC transporter substrate-binding protein [Phytomonospora endophytica]MBB6037312.1 peptide/nickel transport system substrate-binding protein [Phytomonospora endophytica]GIG69944.1 peptide ABC transporter substrate-binding protein [Phytomonospora endophytica]
MTTQDFDLSRRRLFQLAGVGAVGAAGVSALAACSPAEPEGGGSGNGEFHGAWPFKVSPEGHFNNAGTPFAGVPVRILTDGPYGDLLALPSAYYYWTEKKWEYLLAESHSSDAAANTYTVKIRSGLKWSDGTEISSADYLTTFHVQWIQRSPLWNFVEKIEAPDANTFTITMNKPSTVVERYLLRSNIVSTAVFGEWADKAKALIDGKKTMDDPDGVELGKSFQEFRPEKYTVSGPYDIDYGTISDSQITLVKNPNGFGADKVKFDKVVLYNGETPDITPLVSDGTVDYATHGFPVASEAAFKAAGYRIIRPPNYSGPALLFNLDKFPEFKDVKVRRAFAHAIDRAMNGKVALGDSGKGVEFMAGMSDGSLDQWLTPEDKGKLNKYAFDTTQATTLLTEAGWTKDGDTWKTKEGKAAEYEIQFPSEFADWSAAGTNAAEQLSTFGIKVTPRGVTYTQAPVDIDKGEFQLAIQQWGASAHPHPHFSFVADLFTHNIPIAKNQGGKGMAFELKTKSEIYGDVDLTAVVNDAGSGLDEAAQKANVTKAALVFNELLPMVPLFERLGNNPAKEGERVKAFPADTDPTVQNAMYADNFVVLGLLTGKIEPA